MYVCMYTKRMMIYIYDVLKDAYIYISGLFDGSTEKPMLRTFVTHAGLDVGQDLIEIFATNCFRRESPMIHQDMNT